LGVAMILTLLSMAGYSSATGATCRVRIVHSLITSAEEAAWLTTNLIN
jgi:hypothetical protein